MLPNFVQNSCAALINPDRTQFQIGSRSKFPIWKSRITNLEFTSSIFSIPNIVAILYLQYLLFQKFRPIFSNIHHNIEMRRGFTENIEDNQIEYFHYAYIFCSHVHFYKPGSTMAHSWRLKFVNITIHKIDPDGNYLWKVLGIQISSKMCSLLLNLSLSWNKI